MYVCAYFLLGQLMTCHSGWKCITQAEDGVGIPEQLLDSSSFQSYSRYYFMFTKLDLLWSLSYFALIILNFLEVCSKLLLNFKWLNCLRPNEYRIERIYFTVYCICYRNLYGVKRPHILAMIESISFWESCHI
jgi:hypothetical protein